MNRAGELLQRVPWRGALLAWAGAALVYAGVLIAQEGDPWLMALPFGGLRYATLLPFVLPLWPRWERALRPRSRRLARAGSALLAGLVLFVCWQGLLWSLLGVVFGLEWVGLVLSSGGWWQALEAALSVSLVLAAINGVRATDERAAQQRRDAETRLLASQAELKALQAQIRPHVLFNVLNSVYALIPDRPGEAQRMVELVASLLRRTLDVSGQDWVPLGQELDFVATYLEIEQIRLGTRLTVRQVVPPELRHHSIAPLLLQPLCENAVLHGVAAQPGPGEVELEVRAQGEGLLVLIRDSGPGPAADAAERHGLGITRRRLALHYGGGAQLEVRSLLPRGCETRLVLPPLQERPHA